MDDLAKELQQALGNDTTSFTGETLRPRLQAIMTPWMNEGFFAKAVVLVEGEDDRAALLGVAQTLGKDFEADGIAVIPYMGKENLDRPLVIFRALGIPTYVVWDSDYGNRDAKPETNKRLLRLLNQQEVAYPDTVSECFACFRKDLETSVSGEVGKDLFTQHLDEVQQFFGIMRKNDAMKNPTVIRKVIDECKAAGRPCKTLGSIVDRILQLAASA